MSTQSDLPTCAYCGMSIANARAEVKRSSRVTVRDPHGRRIERVYHHGPWRPLHGGTCQRWMQRHDPFALIVSEVAHAV